VTIRQKKAKPLFDELETWLGAQLPKISGKSELAMAIRYAITRMKKMRSYLDHGALELDNNSAERSVRCVALGRKNYLFMGSESGGKSAAIAYTLIQTAKLNGVDPQAWLTDVFARIRPQLVASFFTSSHPSLSLSGIGFPNVQKRVSQPHENAGASEAGPLHYPRTKKPRFDGCAMTDVRSRRSRGCSKSVR